MRFWQPADSRAVTSRLNCGVSGETLPLARRRVSREAIQPRSMHRLQAEGSHRDPDPDHISTSFAERQNLSMRMGNRRYTRLTNAFSRKIENHAAAIALYYFAYNFVKIHRTLRMSPAMAAGVTDRLWEVSDLVTLLEAEERGLERAA